MPPTATAPDRLRRLSALRADRPVVLSLYLNLDPSEFATAPARKSAVRSLVDEAGKRIEAPDVDQEDRKDLRAALERAERFLEDDLPTDGVHALALFVAERIDFFEAVTLPCALPTRVAIAHSPLVAPLATGAIAERWCVVLVNRELGRVMLGDGRRLAAFAADVEDDTHGQHDQGGWSQARYQRSVDKEVEEHFAPSPRWSTGPTIVAASTTSWWAARTSC